MYFVVYQDNYHRAIEVGKCQKFTFQVETKILCAKIGQFESQKLRPTHPRKFFHVGTR